jgi:hypothetical protein
LEAIKEELKDTNEELRMVETVLCTEGYSKK